MKTLSSFADLKKVGAELREAAAKRAEEEKKARELAEKKRTEGRAFSRAMADMGVTPLKNSPRADKKTAPVSPFPRQSRAEAESVMRASLSDEVDTLTFLQSEDGRCYWRDGMSPDLCSKLRRGDWPVKNHIDLHGLRLDPAREAVMRFLKESQKLNARCVRIVHGKGYGSEGHQPVLKNRVRRWLTQCDCVLAFAEAPDNDGGSGAVLVLLRAPSSSRAVSAGRS